MVLTLGDRERGREDATTKLANIFGPGRLNLIPVPRPGFKMSTPLRGEWYPRQAANVNSIARCLSARCELRANVSHEEQIHCSTRSTRSTFKFLHLTYKP